MEHVVEHLQLSRNEKSTESFPSYFQAKTKNNYPWHQGDRERTNENIKQMMPNVQRWD